MDIYPDDATPEGMTHPTKHDRNPQQSKSRTHAQMADFKELPVSEGLSHRERIGSSGPDGYVGPAGRLPGH